MMSRSKMLYRSVFGVQRGFTLVEIMVTLVIASVAILALGAFSLSIMDHVIQSRERLVAVHLAEQVIEEWQHSSNDYYPSITADCSVSVGAAVLTAASTSTCTSASGMDMSFQITGSVAAANAPLASNLSSFQPMAAMGYSSTPKVKLVTVGWSHKGLPKSIYLTHVTR